jgi:hypothetical protein
VFITRNTSSISCRLSMALLNHRILHRIGGLYLARLVVSIEYHSPQQVSCPSPPRMVIQKSSLCVQTSRRVLLGDALAIGSIATPIPQASCSFGDYISPSPHLPSQSQRRQSLPLRSSLGQYKLEEGNDDIGTRNCNTSEEEHVDF